MNFDLTEEQQLVVDSVRRFVADRYDLEKRNGYIKGKRGFSDANWQTMAELGWLGLAFGEAEGGFGGNQIIGLFGMHCDNRISAFEPAQSLLNRDLDGTASNEDGVPLVTPASAGRRGRMPVLMRARTPNEEAEWVAERIDAALASGLGPDDCAVLCRTKRLMGPIEQALRRRGIALQSMGSTAFRSFDWRTPSGRASSKPPRAARSKPRAFALRPTPTAPST